MGDEYMGYSEYREERRAYRAARNERLWRLVIEEGETLVAAGKIESLSNERVRQVISKSARERGLNPWNRPAGMTMAEHIRQQVQRG